MLLRRVGSLTSQCVFFRLPLTNTCCLGGRFFMISRLRQDDLNDVLEPTRRLSKRWSGKHHSSP